MNPQMVMGLFALAVAGAALVRHLGGGTAEEGHESVWERPLRRRLQFIGHVALPLAVGTVFLCHGIAKMQPPSPDVFRPHASLSDHSRAYLELISRTKPDTAPLAWAELSLPAPMSAE